MTALGIFLLVLAFFCITIGIIGCIIPILPGSPFCWLGLLLAHFAKNELISWKLLIIMAVVTVVVEIINSLVPAYFTKKVGGSKAGSWGSTIGAFVGALTGNIILIFLGPFIGALIGELIHDRSDLNRAVKSATYAFLGFLTGTGLRLILALSFLVLLIKALL